MSGFRNRQAPRSTSRPPSVADMEIEATCDLVLPCHDEAGALPGLLARGAAAASA